ncbi:jg3515 [Pararge aegeria aegeria]|uniref:Jg3515 protein n=1 Tax=Pararge aegeria aegeria TaxID=348720 RepID=A0A8S4QNR8_9NEOP|nr:jg3515 [Pararge aegeria aegeria]
MWPPRSFCATPLGFLETPLSPDPFEQSASPSRNRRPRSKTSWLRPPLTTWKTMVFEPSHRSARSATTRATTASPSPAPSPSQTDALSKTAMSRTNAASESHLYLLERNLLGNV